MRPLKFNSPFVYGVLKKFELFYMDTEEIKEETNTGSSAVFLEVVVTVFLAVVFLYFFIKFLFF